jgi:hypothetical protein
MEGKIALDIIELLPSYSSLKKKLIDHALFLGDLQRIHDLSDVKDWECKWQKFATDHKLMLPA